MITVINIITFNQLCSTAHLPIEASVLQGHQVAKFSRAVIRRLTSAILSLLCKKPPTRYQATGHN